MTHQKKQIIQMLSRVVLVIWFMLMLSFQLASQMVDTLDTFSSDLDRLNYLNKEIEKLVYTDAEKTKPLAQTAMSIAKDGGNEALMAKALNLKGMSLYATKEYNLSIASYLEALEFFERFPDEELQALIFNNLASSYQVSGDFAGSVKYYQQALVYHTSVGNGLWMANINNNLAIQHMNHGHLDEADEFFQTSMYHYDTLGQELYLGITALNYGNLKVDKKEFNEAIPYFQQAMELVSPEVNLLLQSAALGGIGIASYNLGRLDEARRYLVNSIDYARQINHLEQEKISLATLADTYAKKGNYDLAFKTLSDHNIVKDSFHLQQQNQQLVEAIQKYEADKKEKEIALLSSKNEITSLKLLRSHQNLKISIGVLLLFTGLLAYMIYLYRKVDSQKSIISKALSEKSVLLKEIHHRVKNNLQVVSSLLDLQTRYIQDPGAKHALHKGQNRVRSMALIHQNLYQGEKMTGINVRDYFVRLTRLLFDTYNIDENIDLHMDIQDLSLDVDTMVPLGLIVNELISNSLKHAFDDHDDGRIYVALHEEDDCLNFSISDNGKGMAENLDELLSSTSLGYKLIETFKNQLKGEISIKNDNGTLINLRIHNYKKAS